MAELTIGCCGRDGGGGAPLGRGVPTDVEFVKGYLEQMPRQPVA